MLYFFRLAFGAVIDSGGAALQANRYISFPLFGAPCDGISGAGRRFWAGWVPEFGHCLCQTWAARGDGAGARSRRSLCLGVGRSMVQITGYFGSPQFSSLL